MGLGLDVAELALLHDHARLGLPLGRGRGRVRVRARNRARVRGSSPAVDDGREAFEEALLTW